MATFNGTNGDDAGPTALFGTVGDDTVHGLDGNDDLYAFLGRDQLFGDGGNDYLNASANPNDGALLDGGAGDDTLSGGAAADTIDGGIGIDDLSYFGIGALTRGVVVDLGAQTVANDGFGNVDTVANVENVIGSDFSDSITGDAGANNLIAAEGNDTLDGGAGNDTLTGQGSGGNKLYRGGDGADMLLSGSGNDTLEGGAGNDVISAQLTTGSKLVDGGSGDDDLYAGDGADTLLGGDGNDRFTGAINGTVGDSFDGGAGNDTITGGAGNDTMAGGDANDELFGGAGNDTMDGGAGDDQVTGGLGDDSLAGGGGNDRLDGGEGNDTLVGGIGFDELYGGAGNDTYLLDGRTAYVVDEGGTDTAVVSADWVKVASSIETVTYVNGAKALPYWIDALLPGEASGQHFAALLGAGATYRYGFASALPGYNTGTQDGSGFTAFNQAQKTFAQSVLSYISSVAGIAFVETNDIGQPNTLVFANNTSNPNVAGYAYYPSSLLVGGDIFLSSAEGYNLSPLANNRAALVFLHEIGHAVGLKHSFEQDGGPATLLPAAEDDTKFTVMSYTETSFNYSIAYSDFDLAALHYLYGAGTGLGSGVAHGTGSDTYVLDAAKSNFIWDQGGADLVDGSALTQNLVLSLNPGDWSYIGTKSSLISAAGQVTVNFGTSIESASGGSGADSITGNEIANTLSGGGGDDTLFGGAGSDTLSGGSGNDTLTGGAGNDSIDGGSGNDFAVYSGAKAGYTITGTTASATVAGADGTDVLTGVEHLQFGDTTFDLAAPTGAALHGMVYAWKGHQLLSGVSVQATPTGGGSPASQATDATGTYQLAGLATGSYNLAAIRATTDSGSAVNSADALAALRIAVGTNPNSDPDGAGPLSPMKLSPFQLIAADANKDGRVNSADALAILRMAVNAPTAPTKEWLFVREDLDLWDGNAATGSSSLNRNATTWANTPAGQADTANLVAVLKGDVNGSWTLAGSAKVEDTDAQYFTNLAAALQVPTDIWGV